MRGCRGCHLAGGRVEGRGPRAEGRLPPQPGQVGRPGQRGLRRAGQRARRRALQRARRARTGDLARPARARRVGGGRGVARGGGGEVDLGGVELRGGGGVQRGVELQPAGLVLAQQLGEDLGRGGHQVGGDLALLLPCLLRPGAHLQPPAGRLLPPALPLPLASLLLLDGGQRLLELLEGGPLVRLVRPAPGH